MKLQLYQKAPFGTWQFGKIGVLLNFIIQKLKSKQLVCLSFPWWQVFLREREKIFYTYSGPQNTGNSNQCALLLPFLSLLRSASTFNYTQQLVFWELLDSMLEIPMRILERVQPFLSNFSKLTFFYYFSYLCSLVEGALVNKLKEPRIRKGSKTNTNFS